MRFTARQKSRLHDSQAPGADSSRSSAPACGVSASSLQNRLAASTKGELDSCPKDEAARGAEVARGGLAGLTRDL